MIFLPQTISLILILHINPACWFVIRNTEESQLWCQLTWFARTIITCSYFYTLLFNFLFRCFSNVTFENFPVTFQVILISGIEHLTISQHIFWWFQFCTAASFQIKSSVQICLRTYMCQSVTFYVTLRFSLL